MIKRKTNFVANPAPSEKASGWDEEECWVEEVSGQSKRLGRHPWATSLVSLAALAVLALDGPAPISWPG